MVLPSSFFSSKIAHKNNSQYFDYIGQFWKYLQINKNNFSDIILAGDFNSSSLWHHKDCWWNHSDVINELNEMGIESFYHKFYNEEQGKETNPTLYFQKNIDKKYHIDYFFGVKKFTENLAEAGLMPQVHSVKVELFGSLGQTGVGHRFLSGSLHHRTGARGDRHRRRSACVHGRRLVRL